MSIQEKKRAVYERVLAEMQRQKVNSLHVSFGRLSSSTPSATRLILDHANGLSWSILDGRDSYLHLEDAMTMLKEIVSEEEYELFCLQQELIQ